MKKIKLEVTEEHLRVMQSALDAYTRLHLGQFDMALDDVFFLSDRMDTETLRRLRGIYFKGTDIEHNINSSYGIYHKDTHKSAKVSCELYQTIRQYLAVENNDGYFGWMCPFDSPDEISGEEHPSIEGFKTYQDIIIDDPKYKQLYDNWNTNKKESNLTKLWNYVDDKIKTPKGSKTQLIKENNNYIIRVHRPRKDNDTIF